LASHHDDHPHVPGPSLWPVGFAVGVVVMLVGVVISWVAAAIGVVIAAVFGFLWIRDLTKGTALAEAPDVDPEGGAAVAAQAADDELPPSTPDERYPRSKFLELSTLGLGGVIGGVVTVPVLGFMIAPAFMDQGSKDHDIGPLSDYPEGKYVIVTYTSDFAEGTVSRRTIFVRNNGLVQVPGVGQQPSLSIITNHCAHLGCPVQPNGPVDPVHASTYKDVSLVPTVSIAGFGCPCHGGQYDTEGNRVAGPPVRALDRYAFSIRAGHVFLGAPFSVAKVEGTGGTAKIYKHTFSFPGEHVDGIESWLYPIQPPH
jgi:Rieske Fe-S protein